MKHRKLRIAWSVAWGLLAVLLCVLWARSYWRDDVWNWSISSQLLIRVESARGHLGMLRTMTEAEFLAADAAAHAALNPQTGTVQDLYQTVSVSLNSYRSVAPILDHMPYWGLTAIAGLACAASWIPWSRRFSLRTLLIATTLVAVALGFVVYATRR